MGMTDPSNLTGLILEAIERSGVKAEVDVVLGAAAPHADAVRASAAELSLDITVHVGAENMAGLMCAADLAISSAGSTSWEKCCLGLPSLLVVTGNNQRAIADTLDAAGIARSLGWHTELDVAAVGNSIADLARDGIGRMAMSTAAAAVCDGQGATRTAEVLSA